MTHPTDLVLSMHADAALVADEATAVEQHLATCSVCQTKVSLAQQDTLLLAEALQTEPGLGADGLAADYAIPKFNRPAGLREFALANLLTALIIWLAGFLWKTLFGELVVNAASWATSIFAPDAYAVTSAALLHYLQQGTAMIDAYLSFIVVSIVAVTAAAVLLKYFRARQDMSLVLCGLMVPLLTGLVVLGVAQPAAALDIRHSEDIVTIAEGETIDDTVLVGAETVLVKGKITGDLFVAGRRIDIEGVVEGNLVAFAETVTVSGTVGGLVLSAASRVDVESGVVGGDLWIAGEKLSVDDASKVSENVILAGERAIIAGSVGKDLYSFAELIELSGALGEDLEAFGNRVRLLDGASIGGDARLRLEKQDRLQQAEGATIAGSLEFLDLPDEFEESNPYTTVEFYLWQIARIVSAVLAGLVLIWLIPGTRELSLSGGMDGLKTAAIGFASLIAIPIAAVLIAFTLVGLPFSAFAMLGWLMVLYLGKIVVGLFIGRSLLDGTQREDNWLLVLLAGMTIVILVANLPWLGGFISFLMTIIGMGMIAQRLYQSLPLRQA